MQIPLFVNKLLNVLFNINTSLAKLFTLNTFYPLVTCFNNIVTVIIVKRICNYFIVNKKLTHYNRKEFILDFRFEYTLMIIQYANPKLSPK